MGGGKGAWLSQREGNLLHRGVCTGSCWLSVRQKVAISKKIPSVQPPNWWFHCFIDLIAGVFGCIPAVHWMLVKVGRPQGFFFVIRKPPLYLGHSGHPWGKMRIRVLFDSSLLARISNGSNNNFILFANISADKHSIRGSDPNACRPLPEWGRRLGQRPIPIHCSPYPAPWSSPLSVRL